MNVCERIECQTSAGCAHRGPMGQMCYFPMSDDDAFEITDYFTKSSVKKIRNEAIEECARVADKLAAKAKGDDSYYYEYAAEAIRALKNKT